MKPLIPCFGRRNAAVTILVLSVLFVSGAALRGQQPLQLGLPPDGRGNFPELMIQAGGQGFAGLASIVNGVPVIFYDLTWINRIGGFQSPAFRFLRAHEYAHHRLGHTLAHYQTPPAFLPVLGYNSELQADCWAVQTLRSIGDHAAIQAGFDVYQHTIPPQDANGRPGGINRTINMRRC